MRKLALLLICIMLFSFSGCEANPKYTFPTMPPTIPRSDRIERPYGEIYAEFFDQEYTHLPSKAEIQSVTEGITVKEAIKILGKPHSGGPTGVPSLLWRTDTGNEYYFYVLDDYTIPKPADYDEWYWFERIVEYGQIVSGPHKMGENQE